MAEMHEHPGLSPLAAFIHKAIERSGKTQVQLSREIGFESQNFLSMIKHDGARLPYDKVVPTAIALKVDPAHLFRLALERDWPRRLHLIEDIFELVISNNEKKLVLLIRELTHNANPSFLESDVTKFVRRTSEDPEARC